MKLPLGNKIVMALLAFAFVLTAIALSVSYFTIRSFNYNHYKTRANEIAATVACSVDANTLQDLDDMAMDVYKQAGDPVTSDAMGSEEFDSYVAQYEKISETPQFLGIYTQLSRLQEANDVNCLYVSFIVPNTQTLMYLVDAATEDPCPTGCIDPVFDINKEVLTNPGRGFPAYVTDTPEYGNLVTAGAPVRDDNGTVVGYAFVDISMAKIEQEQNSYVQSLSIALAILTIIVCVIAILLVRRYISRPLKTLATTAQQYRSMEDKKRTSFADLNITSSDEIGDLHKSMVQMEHDIDTYVDNLVETRAKLNDTRKEADEMSVLARRDALTGIRNRLAYQQEIQLIEQKIAQGEHRFGLALIDMNNLKVINDTYGHDCGNVGIVSLSNTICELFAHSPVFRIGGDEFAVILQDQPYENVDQLVAEFKQALDQQAKNDKLKPWERVSAAIGYALFDEKLDTDMSSVFHRADQNMYAEKATMKH